MLLQESELTENYESWYHRVNLQEQIKWYLRGYVGFKMSLKKKRDQASKSKRYVKNRAQLKKKGNNNRRAENY